MTDATATDAARPPRCRRRPESLRCGAAAPYRRRLALALARTAIVVVAPRRLAAGGSTPGSSTRSSGASPSAVWQQLRRPGSPSAPRQGSLGEQILVTLEEAVLGFVIGVAARASCCGIALGRVRVLAELFGPFLKVANSIPRIVLGSHLHRRVRVRHPVEGDPRRRPGVLRRLLQRVPGHPRGRPQPASPTPGCSAPPRGGSPARSSSRRRSPGSSPACTSASASPSSAPSSASSSAPTRASAC